MQELLGGLLQLLLQQLMNTGHLVDETRVNGSLDGIRVLKAASRLPSRVQIRTRINRQPILPLNLNLVLCRISQPAVCGWRLATAASGLRYITVVSIDVHP